MNILDLNVIQGFVRLCTDGWHQGWHERNGGNLTYRMTSEEVNECSPFFVKENSKWIPMGVTVKNLAGQYFLVTGTGKYMRNVELSPKDNIGIVELNETGDSYRIVWGLTNGGKPTSELPTHIMNHSVRMNLTDGKCRVIYHAHPVNIIAMTFIVPMDSRSISRILWKTMTECPIIFPRGVGACPWMVPGGAEIAKETSKLMKEFDAVVWGHHGLFVSGEDFDSTFGLMHTIEKSAEIYMKIISSREPVLSTIKDDDLRAIAKAYKVPLRKEFLD